MYLCMCKYILCKWWYTHVYYIYIYTPYLSNRLTSGSPASQLGAEVVTWVRCTRPSMPAVFGGNGGTTAWLAWWGMKLINESKSYWCINQIWKSTLFVYLLWKTLEKCSSVGFQTHCSWNLPRPTGFLWFWKVQLQNVKLWIAWRDPISPNLRHFRDPMLHRNKATNNSILPLPIKKRSSSFTHLTNIFTSSPLFHISIISTISSKVHSFPPKKPHLGMPHSFGQHSRHGTIKDQHRLHGRLRWRFGDRGGCLQKAWPARQKFMALIYPMMNRIYIEWN